MTVQLAARPQQEKNGRKPSAALRLDLGAGLNRHEGYLSADIAGKPDIRCDARERLPFRDGAFVEVLMQHFLEHLERKYLIGIMNEVHRVLSEKGMVRVEVPVFPHWKAIADPTHLSFFVPETFDYFCGEPEVAHCAELYNIKPWKMKRRAREDYGQILVVEMEKVT